MEAHRRDSFRVRSLVAIAIVLAITVFQMVAGIIFSGTALFQEAMHNFIDGFVYALPALSEGWAQLPKQGHTVRGCIVSPYLAKSSAVILVVSALGFAAWSVVELMSGPHVENAGFLLTASIIGLLGNILVKEVFHYEAHVEFDENREASVRHVIGDVAASVVTVLTYVVLVIVGLEMVDLIGTLVAGLVIVAANLGPATKAPPKRWHRKKDHEDGG